MQDPESDRSSRARSRRFTTANGPADLPALRGGACRADARRCGPARILETAAGTGVVTEALHAPLPDAEIVATDLNPPMLDHCRTAGTLGQGHVPPADALELPFDDGSFDLVVCQFGVMFFPDRVRGHAEARRVLREGGRYLLAIWDEIERNPRPRSASNAGRRFFPMTRRCSMRDCPFSYHDAARIEADLHAAGFDDDRDRDRRAAQPRPVGARCGDRALLGTPMGSEIAEARPRQPRARVRTGQNKPSPVRRTRRLRCADVGAHRDGDKIGYFDQSSIVRPGMFAEVARR